MVLNKELVDLLRRLRDMLLKEKDKYPRTIKAFDYMLSLCELEMKKGN